MNCFEWQYHSSDHLDGTLIAGMKREADDHLEGCVDCRQRYDRFRTIVTAISAQPRMTLPMTMRRSHHEGSGNARLAPETSSTPEAINWNPKTLWKQILARWEIIPWYMRASLEGISIVFVILIGISAGPRIRSAYERSVEKSLDDYNDVLTDPNAVKEANTAAQQNPSAGPARAAAQGASAIDDFAGGESGAQAEAAGDIEGEDEEDSTTTDSSEIHVGNSEIWRFNLKTDSPKEFQQRIIKILSDLKITDKYTGIEAPGGIQFDLLVPKASIPGLKREIEKIAPTPAPAESDQRNPFRETFTWYMNKSKSKIPEGQTRVVIWLSQM